MRPRSIRSQSPLSDSFWKSSAAPLALAALSCLAGWDIPGALAKPTPASLPKKVKKSTDQPEVYSALENTGSTPDSDSQAEILPAPAKAPSSPRKGPSSRKSTSATYDSVPAEQRSLIAQRLALIETLLVEHGRAYDYRTLTVAELQGLVDQLATKRPKKTPPPARPAAPALAAAPVAAPALSDELHGAPETSEAKPTEPTAESVAVADSEDGEASVPAPSLND